MFRYIYLCIDVEPSRVRKSTIAPPFTKVISILAGFVLSPAAIQRGVSAKSIVINNKYYRSMIITIFSFFSLYLGEQKLIFNVSKVLSHVP